MKKLIVFYIILLVAVTVLNGQIPSSFLLHSINSTDTEFICGMSNSFNPMETDSTTELINTTPALLGIGNKYSYIYFWDKLGLIVSAPVADVNGFYAAPYFSLSAILDFVYTIPVFLIPITDIMNFYIDMEIGFAFSYQVDNAKTGIIMKGYSAFFRGEDYASYRDVCVFGSYRVEFDEFNLTLTSDYGCYTKTSSVNLILSTNNLFGSNN